MSPFVCVTGTFCFISGCDMEGSMWIFAEDRNSRDPNSTHWAASDDARSHLIDHRSG
ncbi:peptidase inhibitor family I36 protein [Micromonospora sp. NBC_01638]|uniref:peptidase inhibitor family I36 protein n=1 Tax=Micromonospora sp. NBC_01638 TaxID=2975982 RepID=UPI00386F0B84